MFKLLQQSASTRRLDAENEASALILRYTPTHFKSPLTYISPLRGKVSIEPRLLCSDIDTAADAYIHTVEELELQRENAENETQAILRGDTQDNYAYLRSEENRLRSLKEKSDNLRYRAATERIHPEKPIEDVLPAVSDAFHALKQMSGHSADSIGRFLSSSEMPVLSMFEYGNAPVVIFMQNNYYCLFGNTVLALDEDGRFIAALNPIAFKIKAGADSSGSTLTVSVWDDAITFKNLPPELISLFKNADCAHTQKCGSLRNPTASLLKLLVGIADDTAANNLITSYSAINFDLRR